MSSPLSTQLSTQDAVNALIEAPVGGPAVDGPVAIEVRDLNKSFRIPSHRVDSFKERVVRPFAQVDYRELRALRDVSFDVRKGEFFGIVGRNGSGKSTLLKIMASIYGSDSGSIRMAGTMAPFIELGVGFNSDLAARDNVILNGVMLGLSLKEARKRVDAVLDFAELRDFAELKLKNFSSGMTVRLAFSVMLQSDAEILLVDEVLAVGDAAFQQKCADVFHDMRDSGRTIVLVTHDMGAVQTYCHRAMLLHDGEIRSIGDPEEVGRDYLRLNFGPGSEQAESGPEAAAPDLHSRLVDAWLEDRDGNRIVNVEVGQELRFNAVIEAVTELDNPVFGFHCMNADHVHVFGFNHQMDEDEVPSGGRRIPAGNRVRFSWTIDNPLASGHYFMRCMITRDLRPGDMALQAIPMLDFVVFGVEAQAGILAVEPVVESTIEVPRR